VSQKFTVGQEITVTACFTHPETGEPANSQDPVTFTFLGERGQELAVVTKGPEEASPTGTYEGARIVDGSEGAWVDCRVIGYPGGRRASDQKRAYIADSSGVF
jgi:hypothetical protein